MLAAVATTWVTVIGQTLVMNRAARKRRSSPGPKAYAVRRLARHLAADLHGGGLLSAADAHRRAGAAAVPLARRGRGLLRRGEDAGAGRLHLLLGLGRDGAQASPNITSPATARRLAGFLADSINWTFWPSLAATVLILALGKPILWLFGPQFVDGYLPDVHPGRRPAGARHDRAGRAAAQHAGRAARLRDGLCVGASRSTSRSASC